jgi:hypothetical protein
LPEGPPEGGPSGDLITKWYGEVKAAFGKATQGLNDARGELGRALASIQKGRREKWENELEKATLAKEKAREEVGLDDDELAAGETLEQLLAEEKDLKRRKERAVAAQSTRKNLDQERLKYLEELRGNWEKAWTFRKEKAGALTTESLARDFVSLDVKWRPVDGGDIEAYESVVSEVEAMLSRKLRVRYLTDDDLHMLALRVVSQTKKSTYGPWEFARAVRSDRGTFEKTGELPKQSHLLSTFGLSTAKAKRIVGETQESTLREIEEWRIPEELTIRVRRTPRDRAGAPLAAVSDGQKATAFLALLLSEGDSPIIIDQPEDDLDNDFIYKRVVDILRKVKRTRQVIIATHNANIPVNGDAELVLAVSVDEGRGVVRGGREGRAIGAIDRKAVRDAITEIMEGGHEAFHRRRLKYSF